jgi:hypothetical protein
MHALAAVSLGVVEVATHWGFITDVISYHMVASCSLAAEGQHWGRAYATLSSNSKYHDIARAAIQAPWLLRQYAFY